MDSLDLHGIRHLDVPNKIDQFLWESMKKNKKEVHIITGHSQIMKNLVRNTLYDYNMNYEVDFINPGTLLVKL